MYLFGVIPSSKLLYVISKLARNISSRGKNVLYLIRVIQISNMAVLTSGWQRHLGLLSRATPCEVTRLRNVPMWGPNLVLFLYWANWNPRWPPWFQICWDIICFFLKSTSCQVMLNNFFWNRRNNRACSVIWKNLIFKYLNFNFGKYPGRLSDIFFWKEYLAIIPC